MKKIMLLLHGWGGNGNGEFFPQIKSIFKNEIEIISPDLPNPTHPDSSAWTFAVKKEIVDKDVKICVCHSLGGTLAMKMISDGIICPDYLLTIGSSYGPKNDDEMDKFLIPPIKIQALKQVKKIYAIASYDDPATCPEYSELLVKQAGAVGIFYNGMGHFINETPLPEEVIELLGRLIKKCV